MKNTNRRRFPKIVTILSLGLLMCIGVLSNPEMIAKAIARNFDIVLFWRVRFELLGQSPKGHHYIDLFDQHGREITDILFAHRSPLLLDSLSLLNLWTPNLNALVNGNGDDVKITDAQVNAVLTYLDKISQWASPELKTTIVTEMSITPLEMTVGLTMDQAWIFLNQDPRYPVPSDLSSASVSQLESIDIDRFHWAVQEFPNYSIDFENTVWDFLSWHNGVSHSWEFVNRSVPDCVVTMPKTLSDPYSRYIVESKVLGDFQYYSRLSGDPDLIFYILYEQFDATSAGNDQLSQGLMFIIYPGYVDSENCIAQSETLISNVHFTAAPHR